MFSDMDGWYKSHLAFILPICFVCYALDYAMLAALGCPVVPGGSEKAFAPGWEELRRAL